MVAKGFTVKISVSTQIMKKKMILKSHILKVF